LLPDGFTATERQVLAEAVVESATGERRILVACYRTLVGLSGLSAYRRRPREAAVRSAICAA
jgi:hypothetical protein